MVAPKERAFFMRDQPRYPVYRRRRRASEYLFERFGLNCAVNTLAKLATVGGGPKFVHAGRSRCTPRTNLMRGRSRAFRF
jgi:hypothetical protein